jgi:hypothetical protein
MYINKHFLLKRFPKLELSYEKVLHSKVYADVYFLIPKGKKVMLWFTYYDNKNVCLIIEFDKRNNIANFRPKIVSFESSLAYGTVLYGTLFRHNHIECFSCENIHYYKGKKVEYLPYGKKINLLQTLLSTEISQKIYLPQMLFIACPIISTDYDHLLLHLPKSYVPYSISCCRIHKAHKIGQIIIKDHVKKTAILNIKATIKDDIYYTHCKYGDDTMYEHHIAYIPDFKTSVMMNTLFRYIKENDNLDLLEESDDEEEFEDVREDKFVNLDKCVRMNCEYHPVFKKWIPIRIADEHADLTSFQELSILEK